MALSMGQLNLNQWPLLGFVPESSPEPPENPVSGQFWHNQNSDTINFFRGGEWAVITTSEELSEAIEESLNLIQTHEAATTSVHGITDTEALVTEDELSDVAFSGDYAHLLNIPEVVDSKGFLFEQTIPVATTQWVINHGRDDYGLVVETYTDGERCYGDVSKPNSNTIVVDFYFPVAGFARVFD